MKTRRPIGVIRPLATTLGRAGRRWRGGPLVPMIWRRRLRARAGPPQATLAPTQVFNLTLVWPAGTAARAEPARRFETQLHHVFGAGRDAGVRETSRLVTLVERLWLRSGRDSPRSASALPLMNAPQPPAIGKRDPADASPRQADRPVAPPAGFAPRLWRRPASPGGGGGASAPRVQGLRQKRSGAMLHEDEARTAKPADVAPLRAPSVMTRRGAARAEGSESPAAGGSPPARSRTALAWRSEAASRENEAASPVHANGRKPATELVWRRPAAGAGQTEAGSSHGARAVTPSQPEIRADRPVTYVPPAPPAPAPAAIQPAEMNRLVDEVVRRLDRLGRDERMRRGI